MPVILTFFDTRDLYSGMGVGKRAGDLAPLDFEIFSKKRLFS